MKRISVLIACAALIVACDKKPGDNAEPDTTSAAVEAEPAPETTPEPEPEPEPDLTDAEKEAREKSFGAFVEGADFVKVGQTHFKAGDGGGPEGGATKPGATKNPEVIASLIAAIGPETMSEQPMAKCLPRYYVVFFKEDQKLRSFKFWCSDAEEVPGLYLEDRYFSSADAKTAGKMLRGILDGTYSD